MATNECMRKTIVSQHTPTPLPLSARYSLFRRRPSLSFTCTQTHAVIYTKKWSCVIGKYFGWEISHFVLHDSWFGIVTFSNWHDSHDACLSMLVSKSIGGHFRFTLRRSEQQLTSQNTARINWWRTESRLLASASICVEFCCDNWQEFPSKWLYLRTAGCCTLS
jgi:hypothetical protein